MNWKKCSFSPFLRSTFASPAWSSDGRCVKPFLLALMSECVFVSHREAAQHDTCKPLTLIVRRLANTSNKSASVREREREPVRLRGHHYHAPPWIMLSAAPLKWALQGQQLNYFYREPLILHWRCHFQASLSSTLKQTDQISSYQYVSMLNSNSLDMHVYRSMPRLLGYLLYSISSLTFQFFFVWKTSMEEL